MYKFTTKNPSLKIKTSHSQSQNGDQFWRFMHFSRCVDTRCPTKCFVCNQWKSSRNDVVTLIYSLGNPLDCLLVNLIDSPLVSMLVRSFFCPVVCPLFCLLVRLLFLTIVCPWVYYLVCPLVNHLSISIRCMSVSIWKYKVIILSKNLCICWHYIKFLYQGNPYSIF